MPILKILPSSKEIKIKKGTEILEAIHTAGLDIEASCGGEGTCGDCMVKVISGEIEVELYGELTTSDIEDGYVLACKSRISSPELTIELPVKSDQQVKDSLIDTVEDIKLVKKDLLPVNWQYEPLALKWFIKVPPAKLEDGLSDMDRITRGLQLFWGKKEFVYPLAVLRKMADVLRLDDGNVTVTLICETERYHVIDIETGNTTVKHYGIAVDLGTTTVAVQLVFLPQATIIDTLTDYNDQISCGLDIISRINYAKRPHRLEELRKRVLKTINGLIEKLAVKHNIDQNNICNAVISGNTTMIHLFLGLKPEYIRLKPYTPTIFETPFLTAKELNIDINPLSWVYFSPIVGSYVGGDITAGLLCTDIAASTDDINLFIDIGTNGEIVIGNNDFLMSCACSAGPAFEGGGIEYGMRAAVGAIEQVEIDPETAEADYRTIGNIIASGICGTGMISLLANLFVNGWIDASGKFNREKESPCIHFKGRQGYYVIVPKGKSGINKPITISEVDIENIIRAKAAIYSACSLMLKQLGIHFNDLVNVYIAGGFGRYLDVNKAKIIGLIPDLPTDKFHYIGNSSLTGSYMVLVSQEYKKRQVQLAKRMTYLELNTDPEYMDQFMAALFLPHTDPAQFPSISIIEHG